MQEIKETTQYKQSLKDKILETAIKAFIAQGIRAVKMDDVASMLGISKRTIYEIYPDKESLLYQGVVKYDGMRIEDMRNYAKSHNVMDVIIRSYQKKVEETSKINIQFYHDIQKYPRVVRYIDEQRRQLREHLILFFERGVQEGYFRQEINYVLVASLFDAIEQYVGQNLLIKEYSFRELFNNLLLVPLRGFCTEKGLRVLEAADF